MNIAFDTRGIGSFTGGVGVYSHYLRSGLAGQGHNIHALNERRLPFSHSWVTRKYLNASLFLTRRPYLDQLIPEAEIFFMPNLNITSLSGNIPLVLTVHDVSFRIWPECLTQKIQLWHRIIQPQMLMKQASQLIAVSHSTKQDICDMYNITSDSIQVIYPGVDQKFFRKISHYQRYTIQKKYNLPDNYLLFLGVIEPRKNIVQIIRAFEGLAHDFPDLHLVIVGKKGWKWRQIMKAIHVSPVKERIQYLGFINECDKSALYQNARLFIFPSLYEGFGFPPLEAMASGVPTITSQVASFPEVVENGAWKVSPYDLEELQWAMQQLLTQPSLSRAYVQAGRKQAKKFSWKNTINQTLHVLESVQRNGLS